MSSLHPRNAAPPRPPPHVTLAVMQVLHGSARDSKAAACSLLQHVLLWQYLKHRNIMALVELALEHEASGAAADGQLSARGARRRCPFDPDDVADASGSCFLTELGIPLVKEAMEQVRPRTCAPAPGSCHGLAFHTCNPPPSACFRNPHPCCVSPLPHARPALQCGDCGPWLSVPVCW